MSGNVKILLVLDLINHNSGASAVVMNYYRHLSKQKVQCDFMLFEEPEEDLKDEIVGNGSRIYVVGQPSIRNMHNYQKSVSSFFKKEGNAYDVVHVHAPNTAFLVLKYAKKMKIEKRIVHAHSANGADGIVKKIRNRLLNLIGISYANYYFACSRKAGEYLFGRKKCRNGKVLIVNNAIEIKKYQYDARKRNLIRKRLGFSDDFVIGHVGRFEKEKNHKFMIRMLHEINKTHPQIKMILLGDGSLMPEIKEQAKELGVYHSIFFGGTVSNVSDYLNAMDIFVLPSLYEGLPVVCVEAQANALPCLISSNVSEEIALTEQVTFLKNEIDVWSEKIKQIYEDRYERKSSTDMSDFDIDIQSKKLENFYLRS